MYPPRKRQTVETNTVTTAVITKEETHMSTTNTSTLVQAILASPELEATLVQLINKFQASSNTPATSVNETPASTDVPVVENASPDLQDRLPAPSQPVTTKNYPTPQRDLSVGILRGTDHYKSLPMEGVLCPNKENVIAMTTEMARKVYAMYEGGMRTLYTVLFPGVELLAVNVMQFLHEKGLCLDLKLVGLDTKTFENTRNSRVLAARVFDDSRYDTFKENHEVKWFEQNKEMTSFLKSQRAGHFLLVSDQTINENLKAFFVQQRGLGAQAYYVSPKKFSLLWDFRNPKGPTDGPDGGGAPAPVAPVDETPAVSETPVKKQLNASLFEGLSDSSAEQTHSVVSPDPEPDTASQTDSPYYLDPGSLEDLNEAYQAEINDEEDDEIDEFLNTPLTPEQLEAERLLNETPVLLGTPGSNFPTASAPAALFSGAPLSDLITNTITQNPVQPSNNQSAVVVKQETTLDISDHVFKHLMAMDEKIDRQQAMVDVVQHYNVGQHIQSSGDDTLHDFALASLAKVVSDANGNVDLNDVFLFFVKLMRYQRSEYDVFSPDSCSMFSMEDPYEYFKNYTQIDEDSQLFVLVCSCIEALELDLNSIVYEKDPREFASGPSLSTPAPSFI